MYIFNMAGWGSAKPGPGYNSSHRDDMNQRCSFPGKAMRHLRRHALNILTFFGVLSVMGHIFLLQYTSDSLLKREPHSEKNMEKYMHYGDSVIKTNQKFEKSGDLSYHKEEVPWDEPKHARLFKAYKNDTDVKNVDRRRNSQNERGNPKVKQEQSNRELLEKTVLYLSKHIKITYSYVSLAYLKHTLHNRTENVHQPLENNMNIHRIGRSLKSAIIRNQRKSKVHNYRNLNNGNQGNISDRKRFGTYDNNKSKLIGVASNRTNLDKRKTNNKRNLRARQHNKENKYSVNGYNIIDMGTKRPNVIKIIISNNGPDPISTLKWEIYYSQMSGLSQSIPSSALSSQKSDVFSVTKVTENVYRIIPLPALMTFAPGQDFCIFYEAVVPAHRFDVFPNWYITAPGVEPKIIQSTAGESLSFVNLFNGPEALSVVHPGGLRSAEAHFDDIDVQDLGLAPKLLLPTPKVVLYPKVNVYTSVGKNWVVHYNDERLLNEAKYLANRLQLKMLLVESDQNQGQGKIIKLSIGKFWMPRTVNDSRTSIVQHQAYELRVDTNQVEVKSPSPSGIFYGIQSLVSLLEEGENGKLELPILYIMDGPRLEYRGLMLDVSRNFFKAEEIIKVIDLLARYKMNKLHLHLSDSQGWRIEIPGLPELTEFGGKRGHDPKESSHLMSVFGSGPADTGLGCGYYSVEDYRRILRHASRNHIEIIPEIDLPGHARAAIRAMIIRYNKYFETDVQKAEEFLLSEPRSGQKLGLFPGDNVVAIRKLSTYKFVEHVISSLVKMHQDIVPLKTIHLGADEVAQLNRRDQILFTKRFIDIAFKYNLSLHLWQDHSLPPLSEVWPYEEDITNTTTTTAPFNQRNSRRRRRPVDRPPSISCPTFKGPIVALQHWRNEHLQQTAALYDISKNCYKVIHSAANRLYLDQPQDTHPEDRGNMWSAYKIDTRAVHSYTPDYPMDNIGSGNVKGIWKKSYRDACESRNQKRSWSCNATVMNPENNYGMEVALWTELIRTPEQMFSMLLPRLVAAAERAWHRADWEWTEGWTDRTKKRNEDWTNFTNTLGYRELPLLEKLGYPYHIPPPGAKFQKGTLLLRSEVPGLPIDISTDNQNTWETVAGNFRDNLHQYPHVYVRIRSVDGIRTSRVVKVLQSS